MWFAVHCDECRRMCYEKLNGNNAVIYDVFGYTCASCEVEGELSQKLGNMC